MKQQQQHIRQPHAAELANSLTPFDLSKALQLSP